MIPGYNENAPCCLRCDYGSYRGWGHIECKLFENQAVDETGWCPEFSNYAFEMDIIDHKKEEGNGN